MTTLRERFEIYEAKKAKEDRIRTRFTDLASGFRALLENHKKPDNEPLLFEYDNDDLNQTVTVSVTKSDQGLRDSYEEIIVEIGVGKPNEVTEEEEGEQRDYYHEFYILKLGAIYFASSLEQRHPLIPNDPDTDDHLTNLQYILSVGGTIGLAAHEW